MWGRGVSTSLRQVAARLVLKQAQGPQVLPLGSVNTIGRHPNCDIRLNDRVVSKEHCVIREAAGAWVLEDCSSLNGTFVNSERVEGSRRLRSGDCIELGTTEARFESTQEPLASHSVVPAAPQSPREERFPSPAIIHTQVPAEWKGFVPVAALAHSPAQLAANYESLRVAHDLTRKIGLERDPDRLFRGVLESLLETVRADRGAIFLSDGGEGLRQAVGMTHGGETAGVAVSRTLVEHVVKERAAILTHDAAVDFGGSGHQSLILHRIASAIVAPLLHEQTLLGVVWLDSATVSRFNTRDLDLVTTLAAQAATFIQLNALSRQVEAEAARRERFRRLLSPNLAEQVLSGEMEVERGGQRVDACSVFNSDIRGFTRLSQQATPETLLALLNSYFERMVEVIFEHDGTLDKFMGDGIMALFGAPLSRPGDADRAVACGLRQLESLERFNEERRLRGAPTVAIGIGIDTGPVVAGYVGSRQALSYTAIGDTANVSARLCEQAGAGQVVISEATLKALSKPTATRELPRLALGLNREVRRFEVCT